MQRICLLFGYYLHPPLPFMSHFVPPGANPISPPAVRTPLLRPLAHRTEGQPKAPSTKSKVLPIVMNEEKLEVKAIEQSSEPEQIERLTPTPPIDPKGGSEPASPSIEHKRLSKFDSTTLRAQMVQEDISLDLPMRPEGPLPTFDQPRGGVIVETKVGNVQFGMPAETIKDCLGSGLMVPQYFVVPTVSFVRQLGPNIGLNVAEFEFPAYCNFFFYKRRVTLIVATEEVKERIKKVFQETLFGPDGCDVSQDFKEGTPKEQMPEMQKELDFFRIFMGKKMQLEDLLDFIVFSDDGVASIEQEDKEVRCCKERHCHVLSS
jgi:hypothetical protein